MIEGSGLGACDRYDRSPPAPASSLRRASDSQRARRAKPRQAKAPAPPLRPGWILPGFWHVKNQTFKQLPNAICGRDSTHHLPVFVKRDLTSCTKAWLSPNIVSKITSIAAPLWWVVEELPISYPSTTLAELRSGTVDTLANEAQDNPMRPVRGEALSLLPLPGGEFFQ